MLYESHSLGVRKFILFVTTWCGLALFASVPAFAVQNVMLTWNPSTNSDVAGYNIYYGTVSHVYTNVTSVGNVTNATIDGLNEGTTYYFSATSYDSATNQSPFSNETSYNVPALEDTNAAPTLDTLTNLVLDINEASQTVTLTNITAGPTNASANVKVKLKVTVTSSNPGLVKPSVSYASPKNGGKLTFKPAANATGTATITVTVNNGNTNNNLTTRSFTITITNAPPTIDPIASIVIPDDATTQTVPLIGITSGSTNEHQTLKVTAVSSNPGLIKPQVKFNSSHGTGDVTFKPAANTTGTATITVSVNDGNLITQTTFNVLVVNGPPTIDPLSDMVLAENAPKQTVALSGISTGDTNESQGLKITVVSSNPKLIKPSVSYRSPASTGQLTFTPAGNTNGSSLITVTVNDGNLTAQTSFTVTVNAATASVVKAVPAAILAPMGMVNGHFAFQVIGAANTQYVVEASTDLIHWTPIQTNGIAANATSFNVSDSENDGTQYNQCFYRTRLLSNQP